MVFVGLSTCSRLRSRFSVSIIAAGSVSWIRASGRGCFGQTISCRRCRRLIWRSALPILSLMAPDRNESSSAAHNAFLGRFAYFGTVPACIAGLAVWAGILVTEGLIEGLKYA